MRFSDLLAESELFDVGFYLDNNPDVAAAGASAIDHFLEFGWQEGRRPSVAFDCAWYLRQHPDVVQAQTNPLVHYLLYGKQEGRRANKPLVVYTAVIGSYDDLRAPSTVDPDVDYVAFVDDPHAPVPAPWIRRVYRERHGSDRLTARYIKTHPHLLLPQYDLSAWVDAAFRINAIDPASAREWLDGRAIAFFTHPDRDCVYEEATGVADAWLDAPEAVASMVARLEAAGYPRHHGLVATGIIIRRHHDPTVVDAMERWWELISTCSSRDQLSVNFVLSQAAIDHATLPGNLWRNQIAEWTPHRQPRWRGLECGGAYLDLEEYEAIAALVRECGIETAVETGAGETAILFKMLGVRALSIEYNPGPWVERARSFGCQVAMVPLDPVAHRYSNIELRAALRDIQRADLLFVDSPIGTEARRQVLAQFLEHAQFGHVLYHDVRRDLVNVLADQSNYDMRCVKFIDSPRGLALFAIGRQHALAVRRSEALHDSAQARGDERILSRQAESRGAVPPARDQ
jgi:hypothetical protein